jgi:hypothetical protein
MRIFWIGKLQGLRSTKSIATAVSALPGSPPRPDAANVFYARLQIEQWSAQAERGTRYEFWGSGVRILFGRAREFNDLVELGAAVPGRGVTIRVTADISRVAELWCRPFE